MLEINTEKYVQDMKLLRCKIRKKDDTHRNVINNRMESK